MTLDEQDLRSGLKFIVGEWEVDYLINTFSDNLDHIPAAEFKSTDGKDFTAIHFEFREDHTVTMKDTSTGKSEEGTWEQTDLFEYHYTVKGFFDIPDDNFRKNVETLLVGENDLLFTLGFLGVAIKKVAEGTVSPVVHAEDAEPSEADRGLNGVVGMYGVYKSFGMIDGKFGLYTREVILEDLQKRLAKDEIEEEEIKETERIFDSRFEFREDHSVVSWMKIPEGISDADIQSEIEKGRVLEAHDGYAAVEKREDGWKAVNGVYYYKSSVHSEIGGEVQSPWKEFAFDEEGLLNYAEDMMKLKRID